MRRWAWSSALALLLLGTAGLLLKLLIEPMFNPFQPGPDIQRNIESIEARNRTGHENARGVIVQGEELIVLGNTNSKGSGGYDVWLVRLDGEGNLRAESTHGGALNEDGTAICAQPPDRFVAVGARAHPDGYAGWVLGFGPDASVAWELEAGQGEQAGFNAVAARREGSLLVGGTRGGAGWLARLGAGGHLDWEKRLTGTLKTVTAVAFTQPSERIVAAGLRETSTLGLGWSGLLRFDDPDQPFREKRDPGGRQGEVAAVAALPREELLLAGRTRVPPSDRYRGWLVRLDARDEVVWEKTFGGDGSNERARAVVLYPDESMAVAVESLDDTLRTDVVVLRLGADGTLLWRRQFPGEGQGRVDGIARLDDGGVVVVGSKMVSGKTEMWVLRVAADGELRWSRTYGSDSAPPGAER